MATFLLIHGAWHGGWCWEMVAPLLEARGHIVLAPDLPGMGADRTPWIEDVLEQRTDAVAKLVQLQPGSVTLVGHSAGGLTVSAVAERLPDLVQLAVFLSANVVADGECANDTTAGTPELLAALDIDVGVGTMALDPARAVELCYSHVVSEVAARAAARLTPEPLQPYGARLRLSADRFGRVPRAYIETADDRVISHAKQRDLRARWPSGHVVTLESDHSPFYSMPQGLAETLDELAKGCPQ